MNNNNSLLEKLDTIIMLSGEMIDGQGEDNFCSDACEDGAYVAVFDGCGGLGSRTYPGFENHTGAYIASRLVSGAFYNWFIDNHSMNYQSNMDMISSIKSYFTKAFEVSKPYTEVTLKIKGTMVRDFPTTAAIAFAKIDNDSIAVNIIWAGDSRVYALDDNGLMQLSIDDLDGEDALSNISSDGALTNVISSDGKYVLHHRRIIFSKPVIIIAASDGCFGYLPSPMHFEYMLVHALITSNSVDDFKGKIINELDLVAGDDYTMGIMSFHTGTFEHLKELMTKRVGTLYNKYISKLDESSSDAQIRDMWEEYRVYYERCIK